LFVEVVDITLLDEAQPRGEKNICSESLGGASLDVAAPGSTQKALGAFCYINQLANGRIIAESGRALHTHNGRWR
jgi:hypothetical protein